MIRRAIQTLTLLSLVLGCGCRERNEYAAPPPPTVTVAPPITRDVGVELRFPSSTSAGEVVEIRARVPGYLQEIHFTDMQDVQRGDPLYTIDPKTYDVALLRAKAQVAARQADRDKAATNLERVRRAAENNAATPVEITNAEAGAALAEAELASAMAAVAEAELNLSYTDIRAPVAGRISETKVDVGNLVGQTEPTLLTRIVQMQPMFVYFYVDEQRLLEGMRNQRAQGTNDNRPPTLEVRLVLADGTDYGEVGVVDYADNQVDPTTGTILVRARFANADRILLPGMYAQAVLQRPAETALLIEQTAIQYDVVGPFVLTVDEKNIVHRNDLELGDRVGAYRVILKGLSDSESVIVRGFQRVRPQMTVIVETMTRDESEAVPSSTEDRVGAE